MERKSINLPEMKKIMVDILVAIDKYCRENDIRYFLAFGTLLGAVRHKGFIPWDDDLDICMPRPDYEKFIAGFTHSYYKLVSPNIDNDYRLWYAKVYDDRTIIEDKVNKNLGVFIDVFPLEGLGNDKQEAGKHYNKVAKLRYFYDVLSCCMRLPLNERKTIVAKCSLILARLLYFLLPVKGIRNRLCKLMKEYNYEDSAYCGVLSYGDSSWLLSKDVFAEVVEAPFENKNFYIIKEYDKWLTNRYGNYMQLPPEDQRKGNHVINAYWK